MNTGTRPFRHTQLCTGRASASSFTFLLHTLNSLIPRALSSSACEYKKDISCKARHLNMQGLYSKEGTIIIQHGGRRASLCGVKHALG